MGDDPGITSFSDTSAFLGTDANYSDFDGTSIILFYVNGSDATPIGNQSRSPKVIVSFSGYKPPFDPEPIVRRMLDSVPKSYLAGLGEVVLSNAGGPPANAGISA